MIERWSVGIICEQESLNVRAKMFYFKYARN